MNLMGLSASLIVPGSASAMALPLRTRLKARISQARAGSKTRRVPNEGPDSQHSVARLKVRDRAARANLRSKHWHIACVKER
ncbi:MAG: hypothetical protein JHC40_19520 [Burkholderiales bacterium]|jgi:hypothetical protein|nr:hypothetical protein [Burkholderiales bacterium]